MYGIVYTFCQAINFKDNDEIDWDFVRDVAHRAKIHLFFDALNGIYVENQGCLKENFPIRKGEYQFKK